MKRFIIIFMSILIIITAIFLIQRKNNGANDLIYLPNREWVFSVKKTDVNRIDTITLITKQNKSNIEFSWILISADSTRKVIKDTAKHTIKTENGNNSFIEIPSPSNFYLKYTALVPSPLVRLPVYKGYKSTSKTTTFSTEDKEFDSLAITGEIIVTGKTYYQNPVVKGNCWIIEATGKSKLGTSKATYYLHEKMGLVYFYYDFKDYDVEMELIK